MISLEQLSPLGIGTSRAASLGSRLSTAQFGDLLELATASQINLIDTADTYGSGDSERLIREGIHNDRSSYFVMTKAGLPYVHTPEWLSPLNQVGKKIKQKAGVKNNYRAGYLLNSLKKSLKRLDVQTVDAFLLHEPTWVDINGIDCWVGLEKIRQQGLAHYTGVSTNDYRVAEAGIRSGQVQLVQTSVAWRDDSSKAIIDLCRKHQIPVIANQVLKPYKSLLSRFDEQADQIHQLEGLSGMSLVQFLIAAALVDKKASSVLFGTSDLDHLKHNIESLRYTAALPPFLPLIDQLLS